MTPKPDDSIELLPCKRCGKPFKPRYLDALKKWASCCGPCGFRNFCDGLNLPTPPEMIDKHTKRPTLSTREYYKKLDGKETCPVCLKRVRVGVPKGGDGSVDVFFRHKTKGGERCPGGRQAVSTPSGREG